ncbi:helix-turn-helix transcriptional regulator [Dichotomicrobium thermohalophilum]|uniref:helix-turn-helix transcriptional regulator n=1 Tax=Dichotomicrobium thermohalophilum TaxID=933063 RepID=UPI000E5B8403|nr:hypothetical protein [Dichotomicrobium thermohalophilum]
MLDSSGAPLLMNAAAEPDVSSDGPLYLDGVGALRGRDNRLDRALRDASGNSGKAAAPIVVRLDEDAGARSVWIVPVKDEDAAALVMLTTTAPPEVRSDLVSDMLGVSQAEGKLVHALMAGKTLTVYARDAGLSYNTVRNQLRSVMSKTQAGSQIELLLTVERLIPPLRMSP